MSIRLYVSAIVLLAVAASLPTAGARERANAQPVAQSTPLAELVARLETASINGKDAAIQAERLNALKMIAGAPSAADTPLVRYTVAYAAWRLAFAPTLQPAEQIALLEDADVQLTTILNSSPNDVEAMALWAAVDGVRIAHNPDLGMTLGMRSDQTIDRAVRLAPANPRVLFVSGQSLFETPPEYGGSAASAETRLRAALAAFAKEPAGKPWPNWGRFDAHAWLGQVRAKRGDKAGARAEYEAALAIAPDSAWVRLTLLPQVK